MKTIIIGTDESINTITKGISLINKDTEELFLKKGIYFEKTKISQDHLRIIGEDKVKTIISYNDFALKIHEDGKEYNTFRTATLMINANDVLLENLTIENCSGPSNKFAQAVALHLIGDQIIIRNCIIKGFQDTLFLGPLPIDLTFRYAHFLQKDELIIPNQKRILLENCTIYGDIDFIFGSANAFFKNCEFISNSNNGYVFAPSTEENDFYGYTVLNCTFKSLGQNDKNIYLGRPWRKHGKIVLINCLMENHICNEGFSKWDGTNNDMTCRFFEYNSQYYDKHAYTRASFVKQLREDQLSLYDINKVFFNK